MYVAPLPQVEGGGVMLCYVNKKYNIIFALKKTLSLIFMACKFLFDPQKTLTNLLFSWNPELGSLLRISHTSYQL
jgi:hypothetical protein